MLIASVAAITSCDAGKQDKQQTLGPAITILGVSVGADRPMPVDGVIQIAFDRYLLPATVNRQSIAIVDAANMPLAPELAPVIVYDPIARTATLSRQQASWLTQGQTYKVLLGVPEVGAEQGGVRAIDGATLFPAQKREFTFIVGAPGGVTEIEPSGTGNFFCREVRPIFVNKCGTLLACHASGDSAAASLILDSSKGIAATALNRLAQGSNTGGRSSNPPSPGRIFGVDMPIIDPGNPGNSWLMYKIELARPPVLVAEPPVCKLPNDPGEKPFVFAPLVPEAQRSADELERAVLNDHVLGREMPFPVSSPGGYSDLPLTFDEREKVRIWIKGLVPGGAIPQCRECIEPTDAGPAPTDASDGAAADASDAGDAGDAGDASDQ